MSEKQTWWTSDLHVDHKNIIEYCGRPWTFEQQREEIITRWWDKDKWKAVTEADRRSVIEKYFEKEAQ